MGMDTGEGSTQQRSKENTRHRLVHAAIDVFADKGIAGATVDDLTSAAGFTRGAFYSNFSTKDEVFWAAFDAATTSAVSVIEDSETSSAPITFQPSDLNPDLIGTLDALRPLGLQWYFLHAEAVAVALRDSDARARLDHQRGRLIATISTLFENLQANYPVQLLVPAGTAAETLLGVYLNRMVSDLVQGRSRTEETSRVLQGILGAFVVNTQPA